MKGEGLTADRKLTDCWGRLEQRFSDYWSRGLLWFVAAVASFAAAAWLPSGDWRLSLRVAIASVVLGFGLGFLRLIGFTTMIFSQTATFVTVFTGTDCPEAPRRRIFSLYTGAMEAGFILVEAVVLFILVSSSTAIAEASENSSPNFSYAWLVPLVYGFFAGAFAVKGMLTALGWAYWLRNKAEEKMNWMGSQWLLSTQRWTLNCVRLLRPTSKDGTRSSPSPMNAASFLGILVLVIAGALLTLFVLAVER